MSDERKRSIKADYVWVLIRRCSLFIKAAAELVQFTSVMMIHRHSRASTRQVRPTGDEVTQGTEGARKVRTEEAKKKKKKYRQAGSRDKAIDLHCQSGEAINNGVSIKRERARV